jgi:hypothetical protein
MRIFLVAAELLALAALRVVYVLRKRSGLPKGSKATIDGKPVTRVEMPTRKVIYTPPPRITKPKEE